MSVWKSLIAPLCSALALASALSSCDSGEAGVDPTDCTYGTFFSDPAWHPGGAYIAVEHADSVDTDADGRRDTFFPGLWLVDASTGATRPLLAGYSDPAWSPDGRTLAVGRRGHLFTVDVSDLAAAQADLGSLRQITNEGQNLYAAWSPSGEWIAFSSDKDESRIPGAFGYAVYKVRRDGSDVTDISEHGTGEWLRPNWSPWGDRIVHERYVGAGGTEIVTMDSSGGSPLRLTFNEDPDTQPRYSPDGARIAFNTVEQRSGQRPGFYLHLINPDGSAPTRLPYDNLWSYDWSPDGSRLVILRFDPAVADRLSGQLWIVNADGSSTQRLTDYFPASGRRDALSCGGGPAD